MKVYPVLDFDPVVQVNFTVVPVTVIPLTVPAVAPLDVTVTATVAPVK